MKSHSMGSGRESLVATRIYPMLLESVQHLKQHKRRRHKSPEGDNPGYLLELGPSFILSMEATTTACFLPKLILFGSCLYRGPHQRKRSLQFLLSGGQNKTLARRKKEYTVTTVEMVLQTSQRVLKMGFPTGVKKAQ